MEKFERVNLVLALLIVFFIAFPFINLAFKISEISFDEEVLNALKISIISASTTTLVSAAFGIPLAFVLARKNFAGKSILNILILLPLVIPPVAGGILLLMVYGSDAILGMVAGRGGLRLTDTIFGIVIAQTFISSPYLIISARSSFEAVDKNLEIVSLTLGKTQFETFKKITFPLAKKGIFAGLVLTWSRAIGEFGATVVMAYHPYSMPVKIWIDFTSKGLGFALSSVFILLSISFTILFLMRYLVGGVRHD